MKTATKLDGVKAAMVAGDWPRALSLAARFPDLGPHRAAILDGHTACQNARFCRQIGKDPEALVQAGAAALTARYRM